MSQPAFKVRHCSNGVSVITFDQPDSKVNTLNSRLLPEFAKILDELEGRDDTKSLVLISGKKDNFIAGADIEELRTAKNQDEVLKLSKSGQEFFNRIEKFNKPIVAAIHGACLGGGFELALSCHYRIATFSEKTGLGLPEVMLGLLPGSGGTQRLPRQIGLMEALPLILGGITVKAEKALKLGMVDALVAEQGLEYVAIEAAQRLADKKLEKSKPRVKKGFMASVLNSTFGRNFVFNKAFSEVMRKTQGLYPAPKAILKVLKISADQGFEKGLEAERTEFSRLSQTPEAAGLMSLFFGQNELKKNPFTKANPTAPITNIAVLGAGFMGSGVTLVSAQKNVQVRLRDTGFEGLARGVGYIDSTLEKRVKRKSLSPVQKHQIMGRVLPQIDYKDFENSQVVIEAVFEDLELKKRVIKEVEAVIKPDAVFASNTSAIPIGQIAAASQRPQNVIGMHYFSPVEKMPLLEIIVTDKTSQETGSKAFELGLKQGKTIIVVNDGPGFYTTRVLCSFMDEVSFLIKQGVDFHFLDSCMKSFGFPVGPVALMDEVGLDVAFHVATELGNSLGKKVTSSDPSLLKALLDKKIVGRKSGKGFYIYDDKKGGLLSSFFGNKSQKRVNPLIRELMAKYKTSPEYTHKEDIQSRLMLRLVNQAALCLQENILTRPVDGDIGAVFGIGFPPFLGGPFKYMDTMGLQKIIDRLKFYEQIFGDRFTPAPILFEKLKSGKTRFYGET